MRGIDVEGKVAERLMNKGFWIVRVSVDGLLTPGSPCFCVFRGMEKSRKGVGLSRQVT